MDIEARTDEFFRATAEQDWDAFFAAFAPGATVKHNYGQEQGVPETASFLQLLATRGISISYENARRVVGADALVEQHDVRMRRADGVEAVLDVAVVLRFDEHGLITRLDEYVDPAGAAPLFAR
ncbi:MAG TPA: nuclear transport factor 2 family protein [Acidimicrobiales bacterium]